MPVFVIDSPVHPLPFSRLAFPTNQTTQSLLWSNKGTETTWWGSSARCWYCTSVQDCTFFAPRQSKQSDTLTSSRLASLLYALAQDLVPLLFRPVFTIKASCLPVRNFQDDVRICDFRRPSQCTLLADSNQLTVKSRIFVNWKQGCNNWSFSWSWSWTVKNLRIPISQSSSTPESRFDQPTVKIRTLSDLLCFLPPWTLFCECCHIQISEATLLSTLPQMREKTTKATKTKTQVVIKQNYVLNNSENPFSSLGQ